MKDSIYIICDRNGFRGVRKSKPRLNSGEVAVRIDIVIPTGYFDRYIPTATITLPEPMQLTEDDVQINFDPNVIEAEVDPLDRLIESDDDEEVAPQVAPGGHGDPLMRDTHFDDADGNPPTFDPDE